MRVAKGSVPTGSNAGDFRNDIIGAPSLLAMIAPLAFIGLACPAHAQELPRRPAPAQDVPQVQSDVPATSSAAVSAAEQPADGLGDIIVTAEKRETSLQRTPISITALGGEELQQAQVRTIEDAQALVPGLKIGSAQGQARFSIRGIGTSTIVPGAEGAVAVNLNEVYVSRQSSQLSGIYDLSSLEVLRGPQGTLYGRNATAGSVNIITSRPTDEWSGYVRGVVGNYSAVNVEAAIGGPIIDDVLLVRVAGFVDRRDGYGRNLVTGNDIDNRDAKAIRATVVLRATLNLTATVIGEYYKENSEAGGRHYFGAAGLLGLESEGGLSGPPISQRLGGFVADDIRNIAAGVDPKLRLRTTAVTGIIKWDNGPFTVKSITGYRDQDFGNFVSLDGGSVFNAFYVSGEPAWQFSEELQVNYNSDRLNVTGGLFYFYEKDSASPARAPIRSTILFPAFGLPAPANPYFINFAELGGTIETEAKAVFGQATYELTDRLSVTAGLRYSSEDKQLFSRYAIDARLATVYVFDSANPLESPTPPGPLTVLPKRNFESVTPKVGVQFQATPQVLVYGSYSEGFKSGNYDVSNQAPAFAPEQLTAYEAGVKTTLLDNRLRVNASAFYYDYTDLQVQQVVGLTILTQNAGTARIYGGELQVTALPDPDLTIDVTAAYLNARYDDFFGADSVRPRRAGTNFGGNRLGNAPDFTARVSIEKRWPVAGGELALRGEGDYTSKVFFTPANIDPISQNAFAKANFFLSYRSDAGWSLTGFLRNATDKITKTAANVAATFYGSPIEGSVSPPRTFGVEAAYRF